MVSRNTANREKVAEELAKCQPEPNVQREKALFRPRPMRRSGEMCQTRVPEPASDDVCISGGAGAGAPDAEITNGSGNGSDNGSDSSYDSYSDAESPTGFAATQSEWKIDQVKTRLFTSSRSVGQCWRWVEEDQLLKYLALKNTSPVEWGVPLDYIDFDVHMKEVAEVRGSVKSLRVQLVMEKNSAISRQDGAPRGDVMVVFETEETTRQFLTFCRNRSKTVKEQEP